MPIDPRYKLQGPGLKRDVRPWTVRIVSWMKKAESFQIVVGSLGVFILTPMLDPRVDLSSLWAWIDVVILCVFLYFRWFKKQLTELPFKLPSYAGAKMKDKNNPTPGKTGPGKAEGILFLGNVRDGPSKDEELWLTNSDARTHILFLGTTGAGKTEGLKALVTNSLCWGSGFVYVDGKAQNTLWGDVYSLARRFGRDDDVLVLNYMTGNSDNGNRSNSLNPFSIGSASYLTQMMVGLMDDSGDDNAMWKGRAISLLSSLMPALTWKRDNQGLMMDVGVIRDHLTMQQMIKMSRDPALPDRVIRGLQSYLDTLPGYVDSAFDDDGNERPQSPDQPMVDLSQTRQQHGYLTMQFTRSLSSLADEYGYIFKQQLADIDMMDVVLNRRILVVLIPALEKSPDEAANLGKIVVAALKGMMGATLGADLEGEQAMIIDNNPTRSNSPFMTVFDEVGYYTSPGMGVMAAQARSLGFCLIFAGQDLPALQKRVKEEAMSICGNCNLKIFGKLEDPTETKDFFEKTVASAMVSEVSGFSSVQGAGGRSYFEGDNITFQARKEASYDDLRRQREGQVHFLWADKVVGAQMFHSQPPRVESVRVQRFLAVSPKNWAVEARDKAISEVVGHFRDREWRAMSGGAAVAPSQEITWMLEAFTGAEAANQDGMICGAIAVGGLVAGSKRRSTEAVSAPNLATPGQQGYWPFGGAAGAPAQGAPGLPPPAMPAANPSAPSWLAGAGGAPQMVVPGSGAPVTPPPVASAPPPWAGGGAAAGSAAPPPWAGGPPSPPVQSAPPPWAGGGAATGSAPPPPWAGGAPVSPPPAGGAAPPPWAGGGQTQSQAGRPPGAPPPPWAGGAPVQPPAAPPMGAQSVPPYGQQQPPYGQLPYGQPPQGQQSGGWGGVMGTNVPGGTPPQGARMAQGMPVSPPPPWMGGAPVPPPVGGVPTGYPPVAQPPMPPAAPPFYGQPPQQGQYPQSPYPQGQQVQGTGQGVSAPPAGGGYGGYAPPPPPVGLPPSVPGQSGAGGGEMPPDVDAILRGAADNLSSEMFSDKDEDDNPLGG